MNETDESWIGSLVTLGAIVGGLVGSYLMHKFGRKFCAIVSSVPFVAGQLFISYAPNVPMICIGRFVCGLATGIASLIVPVFLSEISPPQLRGLLGSGNQLSIVFGVFFSYLIGGVLPWRWFAVVVAVVPTLFAIFCMFIKESPRYLYFTNNQLDAIQSLHWLRGDDADCSREIRELEDTFRQSSSTDEVTWKEMIMKQQYRTPLILSLALMFFQQFSGINAIMFYLDDIFQTAGYKTDSQLHTASLLISGIQIVATFFSCLIVDRVGRKSLLIFSSIFMVISSTGLSLYYRFTSENTTDGYLSWLSLASVMLYITAFSFGVGPIPWFMTSEMVSTRARSKSAGLATIMNFLCAFIVTKEFNDMVNGLTKQGTFGFFGAICGLCMIFSIFALPETKGKSLEEIEDFFKSRTS